ncbi:MAG: response regulator transcription factor, partial [Alphaproteobacteria bacterium]|nr:response regulator transcription factor [Alphaproteobacteria bacterium]
MQSHSVEGVVTFPNLPAHAPNIGVVIASSVQLVREGLAATLCRLEGVAVRDAVDFSPVSMERIADAKPDIVLVDLGHLNPAA